MVQLPKFVALKSKYNANYLRYVNENSSSVRKFLQYSRKEILTPFTKFEFEQAKCDPTLFHIRCYNNKYWVSWASDHHFIVAGADHKEEDKSKWTCTLFRPVYDSCHQSFRFCHVNLGFNVVLWRVGPPYGECLRAQRSDPDRDLCDLHIVIDWESLWSLPKFIAFKGDNGCYLSAQSIDHLPYLQFSSKNIEDPTILMETFTTNNGSIRVKSNYFQKFFRRGTSNWIFADSTDTTAENPDTLFSPTKIASNVVALRDLGNDKFIKRYSVDSKISLLNAAVKEIDEFSHLQMTESVHSRDINQVAFHLSEASIYDQVVVALATVRAVNTSEESDTVSMTFSYKNTRTSTWGSSVSTKLDVKTTIKSKFLVIVDGKVVETSSTPFVGEYKWGKTMTTSNSDEKTYTVTIPPKSTITATLRATKGSCAVPFSYLQADILIGGKKVEYCLDDGVYHGSNYYNFNCENKTKPIGGCAD